MRQRIIHCKLTTDVRYIGGADLTVEDDLMIGCLVVVDVKNSLNPIYKKCTKVNVDVPYIPGLLCFREGPVVVQLYNEFKELCPDANIDVLLVDGCGEWHPRGFGLACYVGIACGIPTIGVSKSFLYVGSEHHGKEIHKIAQIECKNFGDAMKLHHQLQDGYSIDCAVLRTTQSHPFNPIFVSVGHMIDYDSSVEIVKSLCKFREPEPLRLADRISREFVRKHK
ncbi:endonuclease V isoform X2 [Histomonas meleagridis]|uniref:endonuclease V isoform X2 n=1 Tax=Histomonas meleagridis TaxID=135588 RepID=UPI003559D9E6|nr:endonuclease V isoform X2 [Histomonas meleagridis]KAH0803208.1 endonuclease V isoform X2 [Histomonas meleagridis]